MKSTKITRKTFSLAALLMLAAALFAQSITAFAADFGSLQAYGVDTIAGYSTILRSSKTYPNKDLVFEVTKADGEVINVPAKTDASGVAKLSLYDYHTRKAGTYSIAARFTEDSVAGTATNFRVYPDEVSSEKSTVNAGTGIAKTGDDQVTVKVTLMDQYSNVLEGHLVNLISSRAADSVASASGSQITNSSGSVSFLVSSNETGVSVYSAVDVTTGSVLTARAQVGFIGSGSLADAGGDLSMFLPVAKAADAGPLHHFEISDLPDSIQPGANISFRVTAQDSASVTVQNYTGSVHFSVEGASGDNVTLPEDYTFKAEDLGTHLFSLGLSFTEAGTYKLVVTDISNTLIKGEKSVTVGTTGGGTTPPPPPSEEKPTITTPAAGLYSENIQTVSGEATSGTTIKIYDNDQEIGSVQSDNTGKFSYQTSALSDGKHAIYVVSLDDTDQVKGTSDTVEITIDTTPPEVEEITFEPSSGIVPGTVITLTVKSDENLPQTAVIFNNDITNLSASLEQPGSYKAQLTAPQNPGAYPVDVVLYDQVGNEGTYTAQATITVSAEGGSVTTQETQVSTQETQEPATDNQPPSQVFGLIAYGSDGRVTLVWEAANDDVNVNHYRVFFGLDPANLDKVVDTTSAATTWYVPSLENGKEYYFSVAAVDDLGTESLNKSEVVSGIPFALEVSAELPERPTDVLGAGDLHGAAVEGITPPEMVKNGPELIWLLAGTGIFSGLARRFQKKNYRK